MQMACFDCHFYNFFCGPPDAVSLLGVIAELFIPHENNYGMQGRENLTTTTTTTKKNLFIFQLGR